LKTVYIVLFVALEGGALLTARHTVQSRRTR